MLFFSLSSFLFLHRARPRLLTPAHALRRARQGAAERRALSLCGVGASTHSHQRGKHGGGTALPGDGGEFLFLSLFYDLNMGLIFFSI